MSNQDACKTSLSGKEDAQAMNVTDASPELKSELNALSNDVCRLTSERDQLQEQVGSLKAQNKHLNQPKIIIRAFAGDGRYDLGGFTREFVILVVKVVIRFC